MEIVGIIPAREGSTRLPAKPLREICGKPLILWTLEAVLRARTLSRVLVATDSEKIKHVVEMAGGQALMTSPHHRSGTERMGEVAKKIKADAYINIQGDEPTISPEALDAVAGELARGEELVSLYTYAEDGSDPNTVKVVLDSEGYSVYFSRSPVPYKGPFYQHIGVYGFSSRALFWFLSLPTSPLETSEGLEQLRAIYHGRKFKMLYIRGKFISVDTPQDLEKAREVLCGEKN